MLWVGGWPLLSQPKASVVNDMEVRLNDFMLKLIYVSYASQLVVNIEEVN